MKRLFVIIAAALFPLIAFAQNAPDNFNKTLFFFVCWQQGSIKVSSKIYFNYCSTKINKAVFLSAVF